MPTGGSQDRITLREVAGDAETVYEVTGPVSTAAAVMEQPPPLPIGVSPPPVPKPVEKPIVLPPIKIPVREAAPSHLVRNVMIVAVIAMAIAVAAMIRMRTADTPVETITLPEAVPKPPETPPVVHTPPPPPPAVDPALEIAKAPAPEPPPPPKKEPAKTSAPAPIKTLAVPQEDVAVATFKLTTSPAGAKVTFDNDPSLECISPCTISLIGGRHSFVARREGYRETARILEIPRDTGMIVDLIAATGMLSLSSKPAGLTVFIDGKEQARKTPLSLKLAVGTHRVQVIKGTDRQEFEVDIRDGGFSSKSIEWTP